MSFYINREELAFFNIRELKLKFSLLAGAHNSFLKRNFKFYKIPLSNVLAKRLYMLIVKDSLKVILLYIVTL